MSHYQISYAGLEGAEARAKAVQDIQVYLGSSEFARVSDLLILAREQGEVPNYRSLIQPLMMIGVQGFPVLAWYETLFGERSAEEKAADEAWWVEYKASEDRWLAENTKADTQDKEA